MGDYNETSGKTYSASSGSVRLNNKAAAVNKAKPSEIARDNVHAYRLGQILPAAIVKGRMTISTCTAQFPTVIWQRITQGSPNVFDEEFDVLVNYLEPGLGTAPFSHRRCAVVKITPGESDAGTTSESVVDVEFLPLAAEQFGKVGTAR